jgi:hypothetical protein
MVNGFVSAIEYSLKNSLPFYLQKSVDWYWFWWNRKAWLLTDNNE